jgi:hypothetical protein
MGTVIVVSLAALAALAGIVWRIDRYFNRRLDHDFQMANAQQEVDLQNARAQAEQRMGEAQLNTGTLTSQITANNAALLLKAAQDKVAVQVAEAMVPDRIEGERQALTAYNEGRTASMRTRGEHDGLEGPAQVAVTTANGHLQLLLEIYKAYVERTQNDDPAPLSEWLGDSGISISAGGTLAIAA